MQTRVSSDRVRRTPSRLSSRSSERYPDFAKKVAQVERWWTDHVETGISPSYDEKKDAEILAALRTNTLSPEHQHEALI